MFGLCGRRGGAVMWWKVWGVVAVVVFGVGCEGGVRDGGVTQASEAYCQCVIKALDGGAAPAGGACAAQREAYEVVWAKVKDAPGPQAARSGRDEAVRGVVAGRGEQALRLCGLLPFGCGEGQRCEGGDGEVRAGGLWSAARAMVGWC